MLAKEVHKTFSEGVEAPIDSGGQHAHIGSGPKTALLLRQSQLLFQSRGMG